MDKKVIAIIVLGTVLLISLVGLIATSAKVAAISAEKDKFIAKVRETEILTARLNRNLADLKAMLGRAEEEKQKLAQEAEKMKREMKERLEKSVEAGPEKTETP